MERMMLANSWCRLQEGLLQSVLLPELRFIQPGGSHIVLTEQITPVTGYILGKVPWKTEVVCFVCETSHLKAASVYPFSNVCMISACSKVRHQDVVTIPLPGTLNNLWISLQHFNCRSKFYKSMLPRKDAMLESVILPYLVTTKHVTQISLTLNYSQHHPKQMDPTIWNFKIHKLLCPMLRVSVALLQHTLLQFLKTLILTCNTISNSTYPQACSSLIANTRL